MANFNYQGYVFTLDTFGIKCANFFKSQNQAV